MIGVLAEPANPTTLLLAWGHGDQAALDQFLADALH